MLAVHNAPVVTTEADAKHFSVIYPVHYFPVRVDMASFTPVRGLYVGATLAVLRETVMIAEAVRSDSVMLEFCW